MHLVAEHDLVRGVVVPGRLGPVAVGEGRAARDVGRGRGVRSPGRPHQRLFVVVAAQLPETECDETAGQREHEEMAGDPTRS